jgi:hypothetical protein
MWLSYRAISFRFAGYDRSLWWLAHRTDVLGVNEFLSKVFEVGEVAFKPLIAKLLEDAREGMFGAELVVACGGEIEEIVPCTPGVLEIFKALGH